MGDTTDADATSAQKRVRSDRMLSTRRAFIGGSLAFLVILAGSIAVGGLSGFEAKGLLQSMLPTARFLYSAVLTSSATILALMLTLLSLSYNSQSTLKSIHYERVKQIALIDTITFVAAMAFLLFLVVPLQESTKVPPLFYEIFYYVTLAGSAILGGFLVTIVLMLYTTVRDMISIFGLGDDEHPLIEAEESD